MSGPLRLLAACMAVGAAASAGSGGGAPARTAEQIVDDYLSFGANSSHPLSYDCPSWVALYNAKSGTSCAPGAPCAKGTSELASLCAGILKSFKVRHLLPPTP